MSQSLGPTIRFISVILLICILAALFFVAKYFQKEFSGIELNVANQAEELPDTQKRVDFEPGQKEFNKALEMIATGRFEQAKEKLRFIQKLHPNSLHGPEARRILGDMNLDHLLSTQNMSNKQSHIVKPGDSFLKIANQYQTTLGSIMSLNGLFKMETLHPGEDFLVMPLAFHLVIDFANQRIELHDKNELVKEYTICSLNVSRGLSRPIQTQINLKTAVLGGRTYRPIHHKYREGRKILGIKVGNTQLQIRTLVKAEGGDHGQGIFLRESDMEELSMLIRVGNDVAIKPMG